MNTGHTDNVQDLFLLDYTISFGSMDRPRLEHRFLRIVEMVAPMSKQDFETKRNGNRLMVTLRNVADVYVTKNFRGTTQQNDTITKNGGTNSTHILYD